jgi:eukaryotic-like serine/threonine-protein kinase
MPENDRGMSSLSARQVLEAAEQSGLIAASSIDDFAGQLTSLSGPELTEQLVERKLLTQFQAEQLLRGEADRCRLGDRYLLCDVLGAGGMGAVFLACDRQRNRNVAVKILPATSVREADAIARFQREARALSELAHPNIIQAYESGRDGDRHFLVMEYAEGKSLGQLLREQGRQPPTRAADFCYQAALGLHHAHSKGLVHRDVKPSNLLLTRDHCVKLLDLGLARFLQDHVGDATLTIAGSGMGTPDYMAPEQFHDARHADARSDIYSLGCTLYHLIAGCVPFPGTSMSEKFKCHTEQQPQALESFCPDVPAGLVLIVRRMMAKRPEDRFASAHQVGEAVAPFVAGSSALLPAIQATASWSGSRLDISVLPQGLLGAAPEQRRAAWYRRPAAWAWCSTACLLLLLSVPLARRIWPPAAPNEPDRNSTAAAGSDTPQNPSCRPPADHGCNG